MGKRSKHWSYIIPCLLLFSLWAWRSEDRIPVGGWDFPYPAIPTLDLTQTPCTMRTESFSGVKRQGCGVYYPPYIHDPKFIFESLSLWYLDVSYVCIENLNSWTNVCFSVFLVVGKDVFVKSFVTWRFFKEKVTSLQFKDSI